MLLGLLPDGKREVLSIVNLPQESATGWRQVLEEQLRDRGVERIDLLVSDDLKGLSDTVATVFPCSRKQRCIVHFMRNLSAKVRKSDRSKLMEQTKQVLDPDDLTNTAQKAEEAMIQMLDSYSDRYPNLAKVYKRHDFCELFTYLNYTVTQRRMLYTTNWIERLNKSFRRTLKVRNALPNPQAAMTLMGYVALEQTQKSYSYSIPQFKDGLLFCSTTKVAQV